jgi:hypothetical protein
MSEETTAPNPDEIGLSFQDIQGEEMLQVGTIRERFVAFLRHAKSQGEEVGELPPSGFNQPEPAKEEAPAEAPAEAAE